MTLREVTLKRPFPQVICCRRPSPLSSCVRALQKGMFNPELGEKWENNTIFPWQLGNIFSWQLKLFSPGN
jgi:hypothetical protein